MYINDKDLIKIAIFPYFLGTLALSGGITKNKDDFFKLCKYFYLEILDKYNKKDRVKEFNNRLRILTNKAIQELANKQTREINTHKAIIAINTIAQMAFENNLFDFETQQKIASLLEPFQEMEARMDMSDDEWLALRKSAEKQAKRIYNLFFE